MRDSRAPIPYLLSTLNRSLTVCSFKNSFRINTSFSHACSRQEDKGCVEGKKKTSFDTSKLSKGQTVARAMAIQKLKFGNKKVLGRLEAEWPKISVRMIVVVKKQCSLKALKLALNP